MADGDDAGAGGGASLLEESARLAELGKELTDAAAAHLSRSVSEEQAVYKQAAALDAELRRLRSSVRAALRRGEIDRSEAEKIEEEIARAKYALDGGDASLLLPSKTQGRFLKMFLGPINVRASRKDVQLKVKEEYNSYKDRTAILFLIFPFALLLMRSYVWNGCFPVLSVQLYQAWLLFLYTSLALRENILRVNGSDIRPWWIYHHYCAMLMSLISLTWEIKREPDCASKQRGVELYLQWSIMQGFAMLLQNRYQRQRLYTRIALGKSKRMDVVWGETAGVEGQLWLLCPILFLLQGFQAYSGFAILKTAFAGVTAEWQVVVCGSLLIFMAVGNFVNTVKTLMTKYRIKSKMKKIKRKQDLISSVTD